MVSDPDRIEAGRLDTGCQRKHTVTVLARHHQTGLDFSAENQSIGHRAFLRGTILDEMERNVTFVWLDWLDWLDLLDNG